MVENPEEDLSPARRDAPQAPGSRNASAPPLIDRNWLSVQTFDDDALQRELLRLFIDQARRIARDLFDAPVTPHHRTRVAEVLHRLKGSARAIGAWPLAAVVAGAEDVSEEARRFDDPVIGQLRAIVLETCSYAATLLEKAPRNALAKESETRY